MVGEDGWSRLLLGLEDSILSVVGSHWRVESRGVT